MAMILVTGATGNVGRHLVRELVEAGQPVRALTRSHQADLPPGVEHAVGDLYRPESLANALEGITAVHLLGAANDGPLPAEQIVNLAEKAGVRRATILWGGERGPIEEATEASTLEWTRLEPTEFMSNALGWADSIRNEGVVREPFASVPSAMVHEGDVARVAATILVDGGHAGQTYAVGGPEALTVPEKVRILSATIGREIDYIELTRDQARARMLEAGHPEELVDFVVGWHAAPPEMAYTVAPTVEQITGRPARSFTQWAKANTDAFRTPRPV